MDYIDNVNKLTKKYMITFILNVVSFIVSLSLGIETSVLIIASIVSAVISIIVYNVFKKSSGMKSLAFHILTIAISFSIAAVYEHFSYGIHVTKSTNTTISIVSIVFLVVIIEALYLLMKLLINSFSLYKMSVVISLVFSSTLVFVVYYISKNYNSNFSSIFWITAFYSLIFFSSMVSVLFLKDTEKFESVLIFSHFFIFLIVFIIAISIIAEDGSFLELFSPDISNNKTKKLNK